jgi:hypothetical protein
VLPLQEVPDRDRGQGGQAGCCGPGWAVHAGTIHPPAPVGTRFVSGRPVGQR